MTTVPVYPSATVSTVPQPAVPAARAMDYLPIGLFGSVMGLIGLSAAWKLAVVQFEAPTWIAPAIGAAGVVAFVAILLGYTIKCATAPANVLAEFRHPIAGNLFGTFFISLLLLPIAMLQWSEAEWALLLARVVWSVGAVGMVTFAWFIVSRWMAERQQAKHATPAWIVPVVGLLDLPLALPAIHWQLPGVRMFGLAVGLFFAIPLFTMILSRLLFEEPMPGPLQPSLMILIAPFAVGVSTYQVAAGVFDFFSQCLVMLTLFVLAVLLGRLRHLPRCCPFRVAWWAVSFPLATSAIAMLRYAIALPGTIANTLAAVALGFATLVILALLVRTVVGAARGELRTLST